MINVLVFVLQYLWYGKRRFVYLKVILWLPLQSERIRAPKMHCVNILDVFLRGWCTYVKSAWKNIYNDLILPSSFFLPFHYNFFKTKVCLTKAFFSWDLFISNKDDFCSHRREITLKKLLQKKYLTSKKCKKHRSLIIQIITF